MAGVRKVITLEVDEFISRFMRHVLPCGFYKISLLKAMLELVCLNETIIEKKMKEPKQVIGKNYTCKGNYNPI